MQSVIPERNIVVVVFCVAKSKRNKSCKMQGTGHHFKHSVATGGHAAIVRHHHGRAEQLCDEIGNLLLARKVERGGGLICQQHAGLMMQAADGTDDEGALQLPARKGGQRPLQQMTNTQLIGRRGGGLGRSP